MQYHKANILLNRAINDKTQNYYVCRNVNTWAIKTGALGKNLLTNYDEATDDLAPGYSGGYTWAATGGLTPAPCMRFSGMRLLGYILFEFDTLPADLETWMKWMAIEWANGNRYVYPTALRY